MSTVEVVGKVDFDCLEVKWAEIVSVPNGSKTELRLFAKLWRKRVDIGLVRAEDMVCMKTPN